jgi:hypothetical protein
MPEHGYLFVDPHLNLVGIALIAFVQPARTFYDTLNEGDLGCCLQ